MAGAGWCLGQGGAEEAATFLVLPRIQEPSHLAHTHRGPQRSLFFHRRLQTLIPQNPGVQVPSFPPIDRVYVPSLLLP